MNLLGMISGCVCSRFPHLPAFGTRHVEALTDQFGQIGIHSRIALSPKLEDAGCPVSTAFPYGEEIEPWN